MVTYTPNANFVGTDSFTYTVTDAGTPGSPPPATVTVIVTAVNDAPVANPDTFTVAEDSVATVIDVLANDTDVDTADTLTVTAVSPPATAPRPWPAAW